MTQTYNLARLLEDAADAHPSRVAISYAGRELNYADLDRFANRVAQSLAERGIRRGNKVALSAPNVPFFTIAYFGILKAGGTVVPLNVLLKSAEIAYHLRDSGARALLCHEDTADLATFTEGLRAFVEVDTCEHLLLLGAEPDRPVQAPSAIAVALGREMMLSGSDHFDAVATDEDDTAVILYTSGTTGRPKGAELRHRNLRDNALLGASVFGCDAARPDTFLCVLPLFHSFGQTCIQNTSIAFGGTVAMLPRFRADTALAAMKSEQVSIFAGVPTMYWQLLEALGDPGGIGDGATALRVAVSGGAAMPVELHRDVAEAFGIHVLEGYGLSETSPVACFAPLGEPPRPGSIGLPVEGVRMKLIDENWNEVNRDLADPDAVGEIAIRGHNVMKGYHDQADATAEVLRDGWFRSGDLARRDHDGWFYIVDRSKDLIIRGGYNVYPREVEEVLMRHPAVSLCAVTGVPHDSHGEEVKAFVILNDAGACTEDELVAWCRDRMASFKYPRIVQFVLELPMTATGKILKRELA